MAALLGLEGTPWVLAMDRTNWEFGQATINILMISVMWKGVGVPLIWTLLAMAGNSDSETRSCLLDRLHQVFPNLTRISHTRYGLRRPQGAMEQEKREERIGNTVERFDERHHALWLALRVAFRRPFSRRRTPQPYCPIRFSASSWHLARRNSNADRRECEKCGLRIAALTGDREFIGDDWMAYLKSQQIPFVLRLRENQHVVREGYETWTIRSRRLAQALRGHDTGASARASHRRIPAMPIPPNRP
jgi:hypothetical protein